MQKKFYSKFLFLFALLLTVSTSVWAEDVTLGKGTNASDCTVNGQAGIKVGTSKAGGDMTITVPAKTTKLSLYAAAWKGVTNLSLSITGGTASPASITPNPDDGISNTSPFTLAGNESDFLFEIALSDITAETTLTLSAEKRFVVWGASATVEGSLAPATPVINGTTPFLGSTEVSITCSTDGAYICYTLNGEDPTYLNTVYTGPFTINATTTVKAIAVKSIVFSTDEEESSIASKTFTAVTPYTTLGELTGLANNTTFGVTGELLVVAKPTTKHAYVQDDEGVALIYDSTGKNLVNLEVGKTIAANWIGTVSIYNQLFEMVPNAVLAAGTAAAVDVTYPDAEIASVTAENVNKVVTLKGVTYTLGEGKNFTINKGDDSVAGYNQFNLTLAAAEDGKTYDIVGAIGRYNANIQFQPINIAESSSATGIDSMDSETEATTDSEAYNLAGQRVDKNFKGIVVVNGKKLLKK